MGLQAWGSTAGQCIGRGAARGAFLGRDPQQVHDQPVAAVGIAVGMRRREEAFLPGFGMTPRRRDREPTLVVECVPEKPGEKNCAVVRHEGFKTASASCPKTLQNDPFYPTPVKP